MIWTSDLSSAVTVFWHNARRFDAKSPSCGVWDLWWYVLSGFQYLCTSPLWGGGFAWLPRNHWECKSIYWASCCFILGTDLTFCWFGKASSSYWLSWHSRLPCWRFSMAGHSFEATIGNIDGVPVVVFILVACPSLLCYSAAECNLSCSACSSPGLQRHYFCRCNRCCFWERKDWLLALLLIRLTHWKPNRSGRVAGLRDVETPLANDAFSPLSNRLYRIAGWPQNWSSTSVFAGLGPNSETPCRGRYARSFGVSYVGGVSTALRCYGPCSWYDKVAQCCSNLAGAHVELHM